MRQEDKPQPYHALQQWSRLIFMHTYLHTAQLEARHADGIHLQTHACHSSGDDKDDNRDIAAQNLSSTVTGKGA